MNTQIAKFQTQPQPQITIEEQIKIWRDNTPIWDQFPTPDQSGVFVFGWGNEYLHEDDPGGVIVVFNAERGKVRAYPNTLRNQSRLMGLFGKFGYVQTNVGAKTAYCNEDPRGVKIPSHDGVLVLDRGIVVWNRGYATYINTRYSMRGYDLYLGVRNRLLSCNFTVNLWGYHLVFCPEFTPADPTPEEQPIATPEGITPAPQPGISSKIREEMNLFGFDGDNAVIAWREGLAGYMFYIGQIDSIANPDSSAPTLAYGDNEFWVIPAPTKTQPQPIAIGWDHVDTTPDYDVFAQIPYDPNHQYPIADPSPINADGLTPGQIGGLYAQLEYYQNEFDRAWDHADLDRCELVSLYILAIEGVLAIA